MVAGVVTFCPLISTFTECLFERMGRIRVRVAEVVGLEGVGAAFSSLQRLWKCVEKPEVRCLRPTYEASKTTEPNG